MFLSEKINLLSGITSLSCILAMRSMFPWEAISGSADDGISVLDVDGSTRSRKLMVQGFSEPLLIASERGDEMALIANAAIANHPDFCRLLACMGLAAAPVEGGFEFKAKSIAKQQVSGEDLWDRLLELDALWVNIHRHVEDIGGNGAPAELLEKIYGYANKWAKLRLHDFERGDGYLEETAKLMAEINALKTWDLPNLKAVRLEGDVRGNAFEFILNSGRVIYFMPLKFDWPLEKMFSGTTRTFAAKTSFGKYDVRPTAVPVDVRAVLSGVIVHGHDVMITQRLNKKLYDKVNMVLQEIGGKWHTGRQVHQFDDDPTVIIDEILTTGSVYTRRDYEFFWTQPDLAKKAVSKAGIQPGMRVLEPSAGDGALALAAAQIVGKEMVTCFELMPRNVKVLQEKGFDIESPTDFLTVTPHEHYGAIVMNPPFSGGRDMAHIRHAMRFLKPGGRLAAIASTQWQTHDTAPAKSFRQWLNELQAQVEQIPAGSFKEAGTDVETTLIVIRKPALVHLECKKALPPIEVNHKKQSTLTADLFF